MFIIDSNSSMSISPTATPQSSKPPPVVLHSPPHDLLRGDIRDVRDVAFAATVAKHAGLVGVQIVCDLLELVLGFPKPLNRTLFFPQHCRRTRARRRLPCHDWRSDPRHCRRTHSARRCRPCHDWRNDPRQQFFSSVVAGQRTVLPCQCHDGRNLPSLAFR